MYSFRATIPVNCGGEDVITTAAAYLDTGGSQLITQDSICKSYGLSIIGSVQIDNKQSVMMIFKRIALFFIPNNCEVLVSFQNNTKHRLYSYF